MNAMDAVSLLMNAFALDSQLLDDHDCTAYLFAGDFDFVAAEVSESQIRLSVGLDGLPTNAPSALKRRLLEAAYLGAETGMCRIGVDPIDASRYAMIDILDLAPMQEDDLKLRIVDFMLHVEFWRAEGIALVQSEVAQAAAAVPSGAETMIRA